MTIIPKTYECFFMYMYCLSRYCELTSTVLLIAPIKLTIYA